MSSYREEDDPFEEDIVFDQAGLLTNTTKMNTAIRRVSSGKCGLFAKTLGLCGAFFGLGLCIAIPGPTFMSPVTELQANSSPISSIYVARSSGYLIGSMIGGILFDRFNRLFLLFVSLLLTAVFITVTPWCHVLWLLTACMVFLGMTMGFLDTGGNVLCLDLWGRNSGPFMQALHFSFGLGAFVAPLLAAPFLEARTTDVSPSLLVSTVTTFQVPPLNEREKRDTSQNEKNITGFIHNLESLNSSFLEFSTESLENVSKPSSSDILVSVPPILWSVVSNATDVPDSSNTTVQPTATTHRVPKRKPSKTNASSLGNKNWDDVHVGIVSKEDLQPVSSATTTSASTTTSTASSALGNQNWDDVYIGIVSKEDLQPVSSATTTSASTTTSTASSALGNQNWDDVYIGIVSKEDLQPVSSATTTSASTTTSTFSSASPFISDSSKLEQSLMLQTHTTTFLMNGTNTNGVPNPISKITDVSGSFGSRNEEKDADYSKFKMDYSVSSTVSPTEGVTEDLLIGTRNTSFMKINGSSTVAVDYVVSRSTEGTVPKSSLSTYLSAHSPVTTHSYEELLKTDTYTSSKIAEVFVPSDEAEDIPRLRSGDVLRSRNMVSGEHRMTSSTEQSASTWINEVGAIAAVPDTQNTLSKHIHRSKPITYDNDTEEITSFFDIVASRIENYGFSKNMVSGEHRMTSSTEQSASTWIKEVGVIAAVPDTQNTLSKHIHRSKPVTYDNDTEEINSLFDIVASRIENYGFSKVQFTYLMVGLFEFVMSLIFLGFLCHNPRDAKSKQEEGQGTKKISNRALQGLLIGLMSVFYLLCVGLEVTYGQLVVAFAVHGDLHLAQSTGLMIAVVFWGSFAAMRFASIFFSSGFGPMTMLVLNFVFCTVATILLSAVASRVETALWVGTALLGIGLASVFPTGILWIERYIHVSNKVAAAFVMGASIGEMVCPVLVYQLMVISPAMLMHAAVVINILCIVIFVALRWLALRNGEKYCAAINNGYQLASQEEEEDVIDTSPSCSVTAARRCGFSEHRALLNGTHRGP